MKKTVITKIRIFAIGLILLCLGQGQETVKVSKIQRASKAIFSNIF